MEDQNALAFANLLKRRGRLRWTLTGIIIVVYLGYGLLGLVFTEAFGASFLDSALSWGLVFGFAIMALSVIFSLYYVRVSNRLQLTIKEDAAE